MDNKIINRFRFPAKFCEHTSMGGRGDWSLVYEGRKRQLYKFNINEYKIMLNLGASWKEAKAYEKIGYKFVVHIVISTECAVEFREQNKFHVLNNDMCELAIKNNSVDGIMSIQSLEHVFYPWAVLFEMYRVLKDGGRVFLNIPVWRDHWKNVNELTIDMGSLRHCSVLEPFQIKFMMLCAGFKILEHIITEDQQSIWADKLSLDELKNYNKEDQLHQYYSRSYPFLKGYCAV